MKTFIPRDDFYLLGMKIYIKKYLSQLSKQRLVNLVTAHPRLTTILAGFGIAIAFSTVGRIAVHEILTSTAVTGIAQPFQIDYIDKTLISESFRLVQHA